MNRRQFLRVTFASGLVAATGIPALASNLPTIYGDGIKDDTDGLQALFDKKPFQIRNGLAEFSKTHVLLANCTLRTTRTVFVRDSNVTLRDFTLVADLNRRDPVLNFADSVTNALIANANFTVNWPREFDLGDNGCTYVIARDGVDHLGSGSCSGFFSPDALTDPDLPPLAALNPPN